MNKNKLIFAIIWVIVLIVIIFLSFNLKNWNNSNTKVSSTWNFTIWMIWNNPANSQKIVENFKKINPSYSNSIIQVETFASWQDYTYALTSAILADKSPDLFMLNNNEDISVFDNQVLWINPKIINPNDFRKKYKWVFADDLIKIHDDGSQKIEYVKWIPIWYESLWIFYNRRFLKSSDIDTISSLNNTISQIKDKRPNIVPLWIWNWSTLPFVSDIITQFFMLEDGVKWLWDVSWNKLKQWFSSYLLYWDVKWYNWYDSKFVELNNMWQNSIDLFSKWDTFMVVGYPRLIEEIEKKWFPKNFLWASPFPHYVSGSWKTLVNYDYFVVNKDTKQLNLANDFLLYLSSDIWVENYLDNFTYYLPALLSMESDKLDSKIHEKFHITLKDFYSENYELSSFDKWIKDLYDKNIISILDNSSNYENSFSKFRKSILCKSSKISTLENLSSNCD